VGTTTAGLLLAAGAGRRYGGPKALATTDGQYSVDGQLYSVDGQLWVERALAVLAAGGCYPRVVVLGAAAGEVRATADLRGATIVENPDWPTGMGSSLRAGLDALARTAAGAAVIMLVDTPGITAAAVRRVAGYAGPDALVIATYAGAPGHPVLLGRHHWTGAADLARADTGARAYLRANADRVRHVPCDDIADGTDIDA
jgi:CTP:molybdopterin cytidylyltransferase MocA